jgi:hypothetical protein
MINLLQSYCYYQQCQTDIFYPNIDKIDLRQDTAEKQLYTFPRKEVSIL